MTLNKQGPGKIEWTDWTWNPVTGCKHGCDYCYARRIAERFRGTKAWPNGFEPTLHPERLDGLKGAKPGDKIFVCSMADLFGDWVPDYWIEQVLQIVDEHSDLIFQVLTKNPARYGEFDFPPNCWLGATVDTPDSMERFGLLQRTVSSDNIAFVSFEPLLGDVMAPEFNRDYRNYLWRTDEDIDWIIIGAQTGPNAIKPKKEWVENILLAAHGCCPVFLKSNLNWLEKIQEYPKAKP